MSYIFFMAQESLGEKIVMVSPIKCPAWQPILNTICLKLEKLVIFICGIAKFETGALYITYNYIINGSAGFKVPFSLRA